MKAINKDINFAEKKLTLIQNILYFLSSNIPSQSLILMNLLIIVFILKEFISSHTIKERMKKEHSEANLIIVKKYKVKTIVVDKSIQSDVLMKTWSFHIKNKQIKRKKEKKKMKMKYHIIQSYEITIGKLYLDDGR